MNTSSLKLDKERSLSIAIDTSVACNNVKNCQVLRELSVCDHSYIRLDLESDNSISITYRDKKKLIRIGT